MDKLLLEGLLLEGLIVEGLMLVVPVILDMLLIGSDVVTVR
jgi:hypothetical protein